MTLYRFYLPYTDPRILYYRLGLSRGLKYDAWVVQSDYPTYTRTAVEIKLSTVEDAQKIAHILDAEKVLAFNVDEVTL